MIVELSVENLAIIERSSLQLGPGFTVLTGETGAGKSLLIDAIELALGERADTDLIRTGSPRATVAVMIDLKGWPQLIKACTDLGVSLEDGILYIQREILAEGRSQCRIGGRITPVSQLKVLGTQLVDLHGQHDHQSLLDPTRHLPFLDEWIGAPSEQARAEVFLAYEEASKIRRQLAQIRTGMRAREQRLDLLRFQISDIEAVDPLPDELEEVEAKLSRLKHMERLVQAGVQALEEISEGEANAKDLLAAAGKRLEDVLRFDPSLEVILAPLRDALYQVDEGIHLLRNYTESLDADPAALDELANRLDALRRLRKKYGENEAAILQFLASTREELAEIESSTQDETELIAALELAEAKLIDSAARLTKIRTDASGRFAELVVSQLEELAMGRAKFGISIVPKDPDAEGGDLVEFVFSANAGEVAKPLAKIASGGEISRVMLAIKSALAGRSGVPTLIFDEVDAGLGGRAAATVAKKLKELSSQYQVVAISHLPQIASRADVHYRIEKVETDGRVQTRVRLLSADERVEEVARMLAGDVITESALANARELIAG